MIRLLKIYLTLTFLLVTTFCMAQKSELKFSKDGKFKIASSMVLPWALHQSVQSTNSI